MVSSVLIRIKRLKKLFQDNNTQEFDYCMFSEWELKGKK